MIKTLYLLTFVLISASLSAQLAWQPAALPDKDYYTGHNVINSPYKKKLYQRNYGAIIGVQRGAVTAIELGMEAHWRKLSLRKPNIIGATANFNYNFGRHVVGYQAGMWMKTGRVNLTYGGNLVYYSNFKGLSRYGLGPSVGFRLMGFHLTNGFNFLAGDKEMKGANTLYLSLRYYFPVENKFTWDRKTMKKKKERRREREKRKKETERDEKKGLKDIFNF